MVPMAPFAKRTMDSAASSTVTLPLRLGSPDEGPALDEGLERARDLGDLAHEEAREVDRVRGDVAQRPRPGLLLLEAPEERQRGVDDPVLEVGAAVVVDLAEIAARDQGLRELDRGDAAVVVADHVEDAGLLDRGQHGLRFLHGVGQRLLAEHDFARLGGGDRDLGVAVARRRHVHDVDVRARHDLAPVGGRLFPAEGRRRGLHRLGVAAAQDLEPRLEARVQERADLAIGVAVGPPHEGVADEGDVDLGHGYFFAFAGFSGLSVLSKVRT